MKKEIKKIIVLTSVVTSLLTSVLTLFSTGTVSAADAALTGKKVASIVDVKINGASIGKGIVVDGRTYAPVRAIGESSGYAVNPVGNKILLTSSEAISTIKPSTTVPTVGKQISGEVEIIINENNIGKGIVINGRSYAPVRAIGEASGYVVIPSGKQVLLTYPKVTPTLTPSPIPTVTVKQTPSPTPSATPSATPTQAPVMGGMPPIFIPPVSNPEPTPSLAPTATPEPLVKLQAIGVTQTGAKAITVTFNRTLTDSDKRDLEGGYSLKIGTTQFPITIEYADDNKAAILSAAYLPTGNYTVVVKGTETPFNVVITRELQLKTFQLGSPRSLVVAGEPVVFSFVATDSHGNDIKGDKLDLNQITFTSTVPFSIEINAKDELVLIFEKEGSAYISSSVNGVPSAPSTLTVNVLKAD